MNFNLKLGEILSLVATLCSCGESKTPASDLNISNATVDYLSSPGVVGLFIKRPGHRAQRCTGTIVRHDLLLTAAHCFLEGAENEVFPYQNLEAEGDLVGIESRGVKSSLYVTHPDYKYVNRRIQTSYLKADVAFVIFGKNAFAQWPKPLVISKSAPKAGDPVKLIGYGQGNYIKDERKQGIRRSGMSSVSLIATNFSNAISIFHSWNGEDPEPQFGDSGGPILNENGEILGVLSGGIGHSDYVNLNDKGIKAFIERVMRDHSPSLQGGQNIKNWDFGDTSTTKQEVIKNILPGTSVNDDL
jgi:V8-like Glu-specific endopeptidase